LIATIHQEYSSGVHRIAVQAVKKSPKSPVTRVSQHPRGVKTGPTVGSPRRKGSKRKRNETGIFFTSVIRYKSYSQAMNIIKHALLRPPSAISLTLFANAFCIECRRGPTKPNFRCHPERTNSKVRWVRSNADHVLLTEMIAREKRLFPRPNTERTLPSWECDSRKVLTGASCCPTRRALQTGSGSCPPHLAGADPPRLVRNVSQTTPTFTDVEKRQNESVRHTAHFWQRGSPL